MYMVVIGVLAAVLAFPNAELHPGWAWLSAPGPLAGLVTLVTAAPALLAWRVSLRARELLDKQPDRPSHAQFALGRGSTVVNWTLGLPHAALVAATGWQGLCRQTPVVGDWPMIPTLLAIAPFLLTIMLIWLALYPADRAVRQVALETYLFRNRPVRPVWSLWQYLGYNLRHQLLFVLVPLVLILAARDVVALYQRPLQQLTGHPFVPDLLVGVAAVMVALITPEILRHVWDTRRLPAGPLRDRLELLGQRIGVRCRELLVWRAGGTMVNAAVMGLIQPLRYVLITDAMLEQMDDRKIEGVFGHEAGHVRRHHIFYLLCFATISGCIVTVFSVRGHQSLGPQQYQIAATLLGGLLLLKWGILFKLISQKFERQADIFAVRAVTLTGLPCTQPCGLHGMPPAPDTPPEEVPPPPSEREVMTSNTPLCRTAAHLFGATLTEVAMLNGIPVEASSWRHGSIGSRARLVQDLANDVVRLRRFERGVLRMKLTVLVLAAAAAIWTALELRLWALLPWFQD